MTRLARVVPAVLLAILTAAHTSPAAPPAIHAPKLPSLPSIARVLVEAGRDRITVIEEVNIPRGEWRSGDLDLFVAFGAPGVPNAFDAHLLPVADGLLEPNADEVGEPVAVERAPRRPATAQLLLGRPQMAGVILHVTEPALRRALTGGNMASIRIRALMPLPSEDAQTGREVVVRLGIDGSNPLMVGRLQILSLEKDWLVRRAEAHLCGADADPYPLAIAVLPKPFSAEVLPAPDKRPVAPVLSARHASDDLCIRFWT